MNSYDFNKIIGAILGTLLLVMGIGFLAEAIYKPIEGRGVGYALPGGESEGEGEGAKQDTTEVAAVPLSQLLASVSAEEGAKVSRKCQSCHTFGEGEGNKIGPELYGVVGRTIGAKADFSYSDVLQGKGEAGDKWTYEMLDAFLTSPKTFAPGTKMSFAGLRKEQDRANILAYLQTLSSDPVPFPTDEEAPAADEAAPAADTAPAADATAEATPAANDTAPAADAAPAAEPAPATDTAPAADTAPA
ncbi:MAG TPA: cytochrome c family protein, partial [Devosia sp.]|nr:cytochrome c family protein [Devosia sp.]